MTAPNFSVRAWHFFCWGKKKGLKLTVLPQHLDKTQTLNVKDLHQHLGSLGGKSWESKKTITPRKTNECHPNRGTNILIGNTSEPTIDFQGTAVSFLGCNSFAHLQNGWFLQ